MHLAICEDDSSMMTTLENYSTGWASERGIYLALDKYKSAESFLYSWPPPYPYDTIILDIIMGPTNGIELANDIRKTDRIINIIFATGAKEYSSIGYMVNAIRYLNKPFTREQVAEALDAANERTMMRETAAIVLKSVGETVRLSVNEITHVSISDIEHNVVLRTVYDREYITRGSLKKILEKIPDEAKHYFYLCHRKHLVNLMYVAVVNETKALLVGANKPVVDVAQRVHKDFSRAFMKFHSKGDENA